MTFKELEKIQYLDLHPIHHSFMEDVIEGLSDQNKWLNSMYFYDEIGSKLFTEICKLEEYYVTRTELSIMRDNLDDIIRTIGLNPFLIELGSGASEKVRLLLDRFNNNCSYMGIEISKNFLLSSSKLLAKEYPFINIYAVCADFTQLHQLNMLIEPYQNKVFYFPGSTIGNFLFDEAIILLKEVRSVLKKGDGFLIGIDRYKDEAILHAAYDDSQNVTAKFNLNLLKRINRELNANFDIDKFTHKIIFNKDLHRIEMHLESNAKQDVTINNKTFSFKRAERIHTENSYKYTREMMNDLFHQGHFKVVKEWTDENEYFTLAFLEAI